MQAQAIDYDRLAKLLGMLGSDHPGEARNAGRLADRIVRAAGLTWSAIVTPDAALSHELTVAEQACRILLADVETLKAQLAARAEGDWQAVEAAWLPYGVAAKWVSACLREIDHLSEWEREFLRSLAVRRRPLSPRQAGCLERICRGLGLA